MSGAERLKADQERIIEELKARIVDLDDRMERINRLEKHNKQIVDRAFAEAVPDFPKFSDIMRDALFKVPVAAIVLLAVYIFVGLAS